MIDLGPILGEGFSGARGINNQGQIAGWRSLPDWSSTAFLLEDGEVTDLGSLGSGGYEYSVADAINNFGHIVGESMIDDFEHAFKWTNDNGMRDLGTLPGRTESWAVDINDKNEVVGSSWRYECFEDECYSVDDCAFLWNEEEGIMNLETFPEWNYSQANAINNKGQIVGIWEQQDEEGFPLDWGTFIYSKDQGMIDFGELIGLPYTSWVSDINDRGQVLGEGYSPGSFFPFAFLWTPPPKEVTIDIKPGGEPNSINKNGRGVIPVAVFGSPDFIIKDIDPASLRLEGLLKIKTNQNGILLVNYENVNEDEYEDLVVQFENDDIFSEDDTIATLTGNLNDGTSIIGTDSIRIVP
jgi:probable HAF family extracellular repeat protein